MLIPIHYVSDISANSTKSPTLPEETIGNNTINILIEKFKQNWDVKYWTQGFFSEEYISDINVHWLKFEPPNEYSFITLGILYIVIMIVGVIGNGLVIFMFCR